MSERPTHSRRSFLASAVVGIISAKPAHVDSEHPARARHVGAHRVIANVGHNLPQEDPTSFAAAVVGARSEVTMMDFRQS